MGVGVGVVGYLVDGAADVIAGGAEDRVAANGLGEGDCGGEQDAARSEARTKVPDRCITYAFERCLHSETPSEWWCYPWLEVPVPGVLALRRW